MIVNIEDAVLSRNNTSTHTILPVVLLLILKHFWKMDTNKFESTPLKRNILFVTLIKKFFTKRFPPFGLLLFFKTCFNALGTALNDFGS